LLKSPSAWRIQGRRLREEKIACTPARVKRAFVFFYTTASGASAPRRHRLWLVYRPVNSCEFSPLPPPLSVAKYWCLIDLRQLAAYCVATRRDGCPRKIRDLPEARCSSSVSSPEFSFYRGTPRVLPLPSRSPRQRLTFPPVALATSFTVWSVTVFRTPAALNKTTSSAPVSSMN
jgi:hypothetical protein